MWYDQYDQHINGCHCHDKCCMMQVLEIEIEFSKGEITKEQRYLNTIIPALQFHLKNAIECALRKQVDDPIRYLSSRLARYADDGGNDYQKYQQSYLENEEDTPWTLQLYWKSLM